MEQSTQVDNRSKWNQSNSDQGTVATPTRNLNNITMEQKMQVDQQNIKMQPMQLDEEGKKMVKRMPDQVTDDSITSDLGRGVDCYLNK